MGGEFSLRCNRVLRALALWLGLAALTIQGLAPLCFAGMMAGSESAHSIVICTIHGYQTIQIGADGKPIPNAPTPAQQNSTCPICVGFHGASAFTAPSLAFLAPLSLFTYAPPFYGFAAAPPHSSYSSYVSRAPPASVHSTPA